MTYRYRRSLQSFEILSDSCWQRKLTQQICCPVLTPFANLFNKLVYIIRVLLKDVLLSCMNVSGAVTIDNLTQNRSGKKYCVFIVRFVRETWGQPSIINSQVLFLALSSGDTGDVILQLLKKTSYSTMRLDFDVTMRRFTFVTDCAAVLLPWLMRSLQPSRLVGMNREIQALLTC